MMKGFMHEKSGRNAPRENMRYLEQRVNLITNSNLVGRTVYSQSCNCDKEQVNVADLPSGLYFVKVNGSVVSKFVKE